MVLLQWVHYVPHLGPKTTQEQGINIMQCFNLLSIVEQQGSHLQTIQQKGDKWPFQIQANILWV
jgi:hypothetical protein